MFAPVQAVDIQSDRFTQSCLTLCDPQTVACQTLQSMELYRQEYWIRLTFPLPGIFPILGLNLGLPHCRQILYRLSYQGSPIYTLVVNYIIVVGKILYNENETAPKVVKPLFLAFTLILIQQTFHRYLRYWVNAFQVQCTFRAICPCICVCVLTPVSTH